MENLGNFGTSGSLINKVLLRFATYTVIIFAISVSLPVLITRGGVTVFSENGPIEWLQFSVLLASAILLLLCSRLEKCETKELFWAIALLETCAVIREMDFTFDMVIPIAGWKLPFAMCILAGIALYWKKKDKLTAQFNSFIWTRDFSLLWCGFIVAVPFAQLVGHGKFLQLLMGDDYVRDYKRVIEELGELLGYLLILIGSIEAILQQKENNL